MDKKKQCLIVLGTASMLAILFLINAFFAPFIEGKDSLSNLQAIVAYRHAILVEHVFPMVSHLWFGEQSLWQNPLSSFLYLPVTIIFLLFPLNTATIITFFLHIIASIVAGFWISAKFINNKSIQFAAALLFTSPMVAMVYAGHFEKIFSWPWILICLGILLTENNKNIRNGLMAGFCLGVIPLTGSNYYALYAIILFGLLLIFKNSLKLWIGTLLGSLIGLFHLPSVINLIGMQRGNARFTIGKLSLSFSNLFQSLFWGYRSLLSSIYWESYAVIGLPVLFCLIILMVALIILWIRKTSINDTKPIWGLIIAIVIFIGFATGWIYYGNTFFDAFRTPARVMPFVALSLLSILLIGYQNIIPHFSNKWLHIAFNAFILLASCHVVLLAFILRPSKSNVWINDPGLSQMVGYLQSVKAQSVWVNISDTDKDTVIPLALMDAGIAVPNTYYGDMGQEIKVNGDYCGYSFDHILIKNGSLSNYKLTPYNWGKGVAFYSINPSLLTYDTSFEFLNNRWSVYSLNCQNGRLSLSE